MRAAMVVCVALVLLLFAASMSCLTATELTLSIDTDIPCQRMDEVHIAVGSVNITAEPSAVGTCKEPGRIGTIVLVPSANKDKDVIVQVVAGVGGVLTKDCVGPDFSHKTAGGGCVVQRRVVRYINHASLSLPITLYGRCIGVSCDQDSTCDRNGDCVTARVTCTSSGCGDAGATDAACRGNLGPKQVRFDLDSGAHFCIDTTEVTTQQYEAFLTAAADPTTLARLPPLGPGCDTTPTLAQLSTHGGGTPPGGDAGDPSLPVRGPSPCAAQAYCFWAGKHLCGSLADGRYYDQDDAGNRDPNVSEWLYACTQGGIHPYPYGDTYQPGACNDKWDSGGVAPVGSFAQCTGAGIHDQVGNVWEWENAFVPNTVFYWAQRGGSWTDDNGVCTSITGADNTSAENGNPTTGFRCCGY